MGRRRRATAGFADGTRAYLDRTDVDHRKRLGQFFTPERLREELLDRLDPRPDADVLDPACGTGEFLLSARRRWPAARVTGWEIDPEAAAVARCVAPGAAVDVRDALASPFRPGFDVVVGNPPYFEWKPEPELRRRYRGAISGRPNIYAMFVLLAVELLRPGGQLAFVVSTSMTNGAFFRSLRAYLLERCAVEWLRVVRDPGAFADAQQRVMLLVLRKGAADDGRHVFRRNGRVLLSERPEEISRLLDGKPTLGELGWTVRTGRVVWNQRRADLTDDPRGAVRLVWAHQVGEGELLLDAVRPGRPSHVRGVEPCRGPAVVVNRVTGAGDRARLRAAAIPVDLAFEGENHVNVAIPPPGTPAREADRIARALGASVALRAVRRITGNTQVSSRELRDLVPLG